MAHQRAKRVKHGASIVRRPREGAVTVQNLQCGRHMVAGVDELFQHQLGRCLVLLLWLWLWLLLLLLLLLLPLLLTVAVWAGQRQPEPWW